MRAHHRLLAALACLIVPTGCAEEGPLCPGGMVRDDTTGECIEPDFDAGPTDGGDVEDGGADGGGDAGPCGICDPGLHCDTTERRCVPCLMDAHCDDAEYCDTATKQCLAGCRGDADCPATAPSCVDHTCEETCTTPLCATSHPDTPVCDAASGHCGVCSPDTEVVDCAADGSACHPEDLVCTGVMRGSQQFCQPCSSDSECRFMGADRYRCVETAFRQGSPATAVGSFCLLDLEQYRSEISNATAPCPDQMVTARAGESTLGVPATYCYPRESETTCVAIERFDQVCASDDECGVMDVDDSLCVGSRCTYYCSSASDCSTPTCAGVPRKYCQEP